MHSSLTKANKEVLKGKFPLPLTVELIQSISNAQETTFFVRNSQQFSKKGDFCSASCSNRWILLCPLQGREKIAWKSTKPQCGTSPITANFTLQWAQFHQTLAAGINDSCSAWSVEVESTTLQCWWSWHEWSL